MAENQQKKTKKSNIQAINFLVGIFCVLWFFNSHSILFWLILGIPIAGLFVLRILDNRLTSFMKLNSDNYEFNPPKFIIFPTLTIILRLILTYNLESWINLLPYSIAIFTFLLFIIKLIFKLPKQRMKKFLTMIGPTIFYLLLYSHATAYGFNIYLDKSKPKIYQSVVVDKEESRGAGKAARRRTYYALVKPWGMFNESNKIMISRTEFNSIEPGDTLKIERNQGFFGVPWFKPKPIE